MGDPGHTSNPTDPPCDVALDGRTKSLFLRAMDVAASDRSAWLVAACPDDPIRRAEVRALLDADAATLADRLQRAQVTTRPLGPGERIGAYVLERPLGHGGFSEVHLARETGTVERFVALKILRPGPADETLAAALEAETRRLARMAHPSIATVLATGLTDDGRPFIAMEHVPGVPMVRFAEEASLGLADRVALLVQAAEAVEHAHVRGIVHRDLKPANMLAYRDDTGRLRVKVIDFGIAAAVEQVDEAGADVGVTPDDRGATRTPPPAAFPSTGRTSMVGTPGYMAPEQVDGTIDTRTDVFALGAVLHALLSAEPPFGHPPQDDAPDLLLQWVRSRRATPASVAPRVPAWRRTVARDLDWIIARCLAPDPADRYRNVGALVDDLERWQDRRPVGARPSDPAYRLGRLVARHPFTSVGGAAAAAALIAATVITNLALAASTRDNTAKQAALELAGDRAASLELERDRLLKSNDFLQELLAGPATWSLTERTGLAAPEVRIRDLLEHASRQLGDRFDSSPETRLSMRTTLGETWLALEQTDAAALELAAIDLDPERFLLPGKLQADVERLRGGIQAARGEIEASLATHQRALELVDPAEAPVAWGWNVVIVTSRLWALGRHDEARTHAQEVVDRLLVHLGPAHLVTAIARNNQAALEQDHARALVLLDQTITSFDEAGHGNHRDALVARSNRLVRLRILRRFARLERELEDVHDRRLRALGPDHSHTIHAALGLVRLQLNRGELRDATQRLHEIRRRAAHLPADVHARLHAELLAMAGTVARFRDDGPAAVSLCDELVTHCDRQWGPDHPFTRFYALLLIDAMLCDDRLEEAEIAFATTASETDITALQGVHLGMHHLVRARIAAARRRMGEAASCAETAIEALEPVVEPGDPHLRVARSIARGGDGNGYPDLDPGVGE